MAAKHTPHDAVFFINAIRRGDYDEAKSLLGKGVNPDITFLCHSRTQEHTALMNLLYLDFPYKTESLIRALVHHGADVNRLNGDFTPLSICAFNGYQENAILLLELGAKLKLGFTDKDDAIQMATLNRNFELVSMLLERQAKIQNESLQKAASELTLTATDEITIKRSRL